MNKEWTKNWRRDHREHDNVPSGFVNEEWEPPEEWFEGIKKQLRKRHEEGIPGPPSDAVPVRHGVRHWRRVRETFEKACQRVAKPEGFSDPGPPLAAVDPTEPHTVVTPTGIVLTRKYDDPVRHGVKHWRHVKQKAYSVVAKREEASYPGPPAAADDEHSEVKAEKEDHAAENKLSEVKAKHDCIKTMGLREAWAVPRNDAWETSCKGALDALQQGTMSDDELPFCKEALDALQQGTMSDDELSEVSAEQTAHPPTPPRRTTQIDTRANSLLASSQDRRQPDEPMHSMAQESATLFCCCFSIFFCILQFFIFVRFVSNIFLFFFGPYAHVLHKEAVSSHRIVWKRGLPWPSAKHGLGYRPFDPKTMLCESQVQAREEGPADEASSSRAEG